MTTWPHPIRNDRSVSIKTIVLLALAFGLLFFLTMARSLQGGDSSEFIVVAHRGGIAHPPGYPLYTLLGRSLCWLPFSNPAVPLSLLSATCSVGALICLYLALRRWELGIHTSWICVAVFGVTPFFWRYSGVAEVFSLNACLAALLIWSAGQGPGPRGWLRAALSGAMFGLGLANHHSIVLLLPFAVLAWMRAWQEMNRRGWLVLIIAWGALMVGLTPYLAFLGAPRSTGWYWGGVMDWRALIDHFLRREYGTFSLGITDQNPQPMANTLAYLAHLPRGFTILLPLGVAGLIFAVGSLKGLRDRIKASMDSAALLLSFVLASVLFLGMFNLHPHQSGFVTERFFLLPDLMFAMFCAIGLERLVVWQPRVKEYLREVGVGLVCALVLVNFPLADWSRDFGVEDYAFNALDTVRPNSVILGTGELSLFGLMAASQVFVYRTDVVYIDLNLFRTRWYHQQVQAALPDSLLPFDEHLTPVSELALVLLEDHPLYLAGSRIPAALREGFHLVPIGPLLAVLHPDATAPLLPQVEQINRVTFERLRFRTQQPSAWNAWSRLAHSFYSRTWNDIAENYQRLGHDAHATGIRSLAKRYSFDD